MSNANTPAMMAQSMAESLLRENRVLKEHNEHLVRETVKMAADVSAIQRAHDEQKLRLYTEIRSLKEQSALLTVQGSIIAYYDFDIEGGTYLVDANYYLTHREEIESRGWKMKPLRDNYTLSALPQQVKSEDARDAERYRWLKSQSDGRPFYFHGIGHKYPENLDAAIDAAISAQEKTK